MTLSIQPVTKDNWRALVSLKVREDQTHFVASNVYSIAEAQFGQDEADGSHWKMYPFGIYEDETPVGFLMYGQNDQYADYQTFIIRLMVDENHQGKGYGKFGIESLLESFRRDERIQNVGISYEPENEGARRLYASLDFVETGKMLEGEIEAVCKLR
ncbi:MAG TPA: GNAT family N-acetyltransferase [Anaerolineales bacterium]|nr:GNAT family N-acetyltransferase [Anaerolineales bacterium]